MKGTTESHKERHLPHPCTHRVKESIFSLSKKKIKKNKGCPHKLATIPRGIMVSSFTLFAQTEEAVVKAVASPHGDLANHNS